MATAKISEYAALVVDHQGKVVPVAQEPPLTTQEVTFTTETDSNAFDANTKFVRVVADAKAHFRFGTGVQAAVATDPYLAADLPEYFGVIGGDQVSFYDGTS